MAASAAGAIEAAAIEIATRVEIKEKRLIRRGVFVMRSGTLPQMTLEIECIMCLNKSSFWC